MRCFVMFVTAVCILFPLKLKWPKNKSLYDSVPSCKLFRGVLQGLVARTRPLVCVEPTVKQHGDVSLIESFKQTTNRGGSRIFVRRGCTSKE